MKRGLYKSEAVVLGSMSYGESDSILTFFTPRYGKVKGIAKGARRSRRRFVGTLEPPSTVNVNFFCSGKSDLLRVEDAKLIDAYATLKSDIDSLSYASYLLELASEMNAQWEPSEEVFNILRTFLTLLSGTLNNEFLVSCYELRLLEALGLMPRLDACVLCGCAPCAGKLFFSSSCGGLVCFDCAGGRLTGSGALIPFSLGTVSFLRAAVRFDIDKLHRLVPNRILLDESESVLSDFIRSHIGKEMKTKKFMESLRCAGI